MTVPIKTQNNPPKPPLISPELSDLTGDKFISLIIPRFKIDALPQVGVSPTAKLTLGQIPKLPCK